MRQNGSFGIWVFVIMAGLGGALAFIVYGIAGNDAAIGIGVVAFAFAIIVSSAKGACLKQMMRDMLIKHKVYIDQPGQDLSEIRHWKWGNSK